MTPPAEGRHAASPARAKRAALIGLGCIASASVLSAAFLAFAVAQTPLPPRLTTERPKPSLRILDRDGRLIDELTREGIRQTPVDLDGLPPHVIQALLSAEDKRFFSHHGVDPLAVLRALGQALTSGHIVSGASTLTQQLARQLVPRPRTLRGKLSEMILALRIEQSLDKRAILAAYLDLVEFGPRVRGLGAASLTYLDKPATDLSVGEAALLVGLVRGPSYYSLARGTERATERRSRVLGRMVKDGFLNEARAERARAEPVVLRAGEARRGAEHLAQALRAGKLHDLGPVRPKSITTTLDLSLQRDVGALARGAARRLEQHDASGVAVIVVDNRTREVLAYVGSANFWDAESLGQNDGARARRQPGSALKPFVYASAVERLGYNAATLLPDVEIHLSTPAGTYSPRNYDGKFHGPVRLRQALASSLNVPAVVTADRVGPSAVLETLHHFGFASLDRSATDYGVAIALGDGEVTLLELARAYAALANGGVLEELSFVREATDEGGAVVRAKPRAETRAASETTAALVTDILSDPAAREAGFGRNSVLEFDFPVAAKTGTSKGSRDNWAVGYSSELTVAVWVGNFDGHPMRGTSGVTGAGPLFSAVMLRAMRDRAARPLDTLAGLPARALCPLSGMLAGPACPHRVTEHFAPGSEPGAACTFHASVPITIDSHLPGDPKRCLTRAERFETYPALYAGWAKSAGRPLVPEGTDPRCPLALPERDEDLLAVVYPAAGAHFARDPSLPAEQQVLRFRARGPSGQSLVFVLDGRPVPSDREAPTRALWQLVQGEHELIVRAAERTSAPVRFTVE